MEDTQAPSTMISFDGANTWIDPDKCRRSGTLLSANVEQIYEGDPIIRVRQNYHDPGQDPRTSPAKEVEYRSRISSRLMPAKQFDEFFSELEGNIGKTVTITAYPTGLQVDMPPVAQQAR